MKKNIYLIAILLCQFNLLAQDNFTYMKAHELTMLGRMSANNKNYQRIDSTDVISLPPAVQKYAKFSAGMNIIFQTNSKSIRVHWKLARLNSLWNMTSVAVNGLDLYGWNGKTWQYISSARPTSTDNNVLLVENMNGEMRSYRMFLPIYAEITELEIGVQKEASLLPANQTLLPTKKVAIYGSSITQGIAASRPGMTYPSILARKLNIDFINLGFSGSGKMELEIADVLAKIPAEIYIMDCVPNTLPDQVKERAYPLIARLRKLKPNVPIIMVESVKREISNWNSMMGERIKGQNGEYKKTYNRLIAEGMKDLYYISAENLMGTDHDATVDGTHLTDLGFMRISETIGKQLKQIMAIKQ